ncbi:HAD family hydrolase [Thermodesulforhabdus norvegica]|uniref:Beta-phosphoglucomutase n=1 Tax=Thermodesulforhabdus norvegica TaxID=39841 RepID=A0A1I4VE70_9BACT|nr:HAD family phosphatase [Thermodesulforhabdus norvegica]SFM99469.1 beta-phosphoglucomutase [Thermodesulforhabdus norvegica]
MGRIEAIFFDCDGVIVDTEPVHYRSFLETLKPFGIYFTYETYAKKYIGFDDRDGFREILREHNVRPEQALIERLIAEKNAKVLRYASEVKPFDGVVDFIKAAKASNMSLALVSGALRNEVLAFLKSIGLYDAFDVFVTAEDVTKSKPDPESYLLARRKLELLLGRTLSPEKCVVFEDTPSGVEAAKKAGLQVIAVTNSFPAESLGAADMVIAGFSGMTPEKLGLLLDD